MDPFEAFKATQKTMWPGFAPMETFTTPPAARLIKHAAIKAGQRVLDVGCGTGVTSVTAARLGAKVTGLDLTPELLDRARTNARIANVEIEWREGDAEKLPFADGSFDVVISQFGHIFAPRPDVATSEMLRVLKSGGTIAFSTWPPELFTGHMFVLLSKYMPPPPPGVAPPVQWGDVHVVKERLGENVKDLAFDRADMWVPAMSPAHHRAGAEHGVGPVSKLVEMLKDQPEKLSAFRAEYDALTSEYFSDNLVRQSFLMTRAIKI